MLGDKRPQPWEAEHLTFGVVSLYQPVAVEEGCFTSFQGDLFLLITHPRHKPQRHPPGPQLPAVATTPHVGQVMACVGVAQASALGIEYAIEAGDEHVGWDASQQRLVDPLKYLP